MRCSVQFSSPIEQLLATVQYGSRVCACAQSIRGYRRSGCRFALCVLLCVLSLGVLPALLYMRPGLRLVLTHAACPLAIATSVLLRVRSPPLPSPPLSRPSPAPHQLYGTCMTRVQYRYGSREVHIQVCLMRASLENLGLQCHFLNA